MIPKPAFDRLCNNMNEEQISSNRQGQTWLQPRGLAAFTHSKEWQVKLSLETRNLGEVMVVRCQGRIVYREEATALSHLVGNLIDKGGKVVLDLADVHSIDSAGIGELVFLHTWAQARQVELKCASPSRFVSNLLHLTNLNSVLEIHPSVNEAVAAFQPTEVCANC